LFLLLSFFPYWFTTWQVWMSKFLSCASDVFKLFMRLTNTSLVMYRNGLYIYKFYFYQTILWQCITRIAHMSQKVLPLFAHKTYLSIRIVELCIYTVYVYKMWVPLSKNPLTPYLWNFWQPWQLLWLWAGMKAHWYFWGE
jgi:hypothetical protein